MPVIETTLRAMLIALALLATAATAQPSPSAMKRYPWDVRPGKCFLPGATTTGPSCTPSVDWPDYSESVSRVGDLFMEPDFELVARAERELAFSEERFPAGNYYSDAWYAGLERLFKTQPDRGRKALVAWKSQLGNDGSAPLAEALVHVGEAWEARGEGYSKGVSAEGWKMYHASLANAIGVLDHASEELKATGPWHALRLSILLQQTEERAAAIEEFRQATDRWPHYRRLYATAVKYSLPRWGGDFDVIDGIARAMLEKTRAEQGAGMYAWLYATQIASDGTHTMRDTRVDWPLMKQGIRDLTERESTHVSVFEWLARAACQMEDRSEARRIYETLDRRAKTAEASPSRTDSCRAYAMAK